MTWNDPIGDTLNSGAMNEGFFQYADYVVPQIHQKVHNSLKIFGTPFTFSRIRSGARTIIHGGAYKQYRGSDAASKDAWENTGLIKRWYLEDYGPRAWWHGPTQWMFDPHNPQLSNMLLFNRTGRTRVGKAVENRLLDRITKEGGKGEDSLIRKWGILNDQGELGHFWDPRILSRISAAGDYGHMGYKALSDEKVGNLKDFLKISGNPDMAAHLDELLKTGSITGKLAAEAVNLSTIGSVSGRLMGFREGLAGGGKVFGDVASEGVRTGLRWGDSARAWGTDEQDNPLKWGDIFKGQATSRAESTAAKSVAKNVAEDAAKPIAKDVAETAGKTAVMNAAKQAMARAGIELAAAGSEGGLNPVMDAIAIYGMVRAGLSIGKIAVDAVAGEVKDAAASFRGSIGKTPFGMGYVDTQAAATSRQRSEMAIMRSRINARSIFGNEASSMYAHFG